MSHFFYKPPCFYTSPELTYKTLDSVDGDVYVYVVLRLNLHYCIQKEMPFCFLVVKKSPDAFLKERQMISQ